MSGVGETARSLPRPAFRREESNVHLRPPDQADAGWSGESARGAEYLDKITKIVEAEGGHLERVSLRVGARRRSRRPRAAVRDRPKRPCQGLGGDCMDGVGG